MAVERLKRGVILGLVAAVFGAVVGMTPRMLEMDETVGLAALFATREPAGSAEEVVLIGISRSTAESLGLPEELDEWPRSMHAALVDRLTSAGAAVIVFDIIFSELRDSSDANTFADAIERAGNVLLLERTEAGDDMLDGVSGAGGIVVQRQELPHSRFKAVSFGSAPFTLPTVPVRVNQFWIFDRGGGNRPTLPSLALQAYGRDALTRLVRLISREDPSLIGARTRELLDSGESTELEVVVQEIRDAFDRQPQLARSLRSELVDRSEGSALVSEAVLRMYAGPNTGYLNYYGPAGTIRTVPYQEIVARPLDSLAELDLAGKVVFIGLSESRQSEQIDTFYSVFSERSGRNLSGVEIGATAFANLLDRELITPLPMIWHLLLLLSWGNVIGFVMMLGGGRATTVFVAAAAAAYAVVTVVTFAGANLWLPLVVPVLLQVPVVMLLGTLWKQALERRQKDHFRSALTSYVPTPVVTQIDHGEISRDSLQQELRGTCLITDVVQYTKISETVPPSDLAALMNEYYDLLFRAVEAQDGIVTDTAGDSMLAVWGSEDRDPDPENCRRACISALAIRAEVERLNRRKTVNQLVTGLGLATGEIMLANIGSDSQFNYRAVGDVVNTASRIQTLNRRLGTSILASADSVVPSDDFEWRELGDFVLAGKTKAVAIRQLLDPSHPDDSSILVSSELFAAALRAFREGLWKDAAKQFSDVIDETPNDGAAAFFRDLSRTHAAAGTAPEPDGVVRLQDK